MKIRSFQNTWSDQRSSIFGLSRKLRRANEIPSNMLCPLMELLYAGRFEIHAYRCKHSRYVTCQSLGNCKRLLILMVHINKRLKIFRINGKLFHNCKTYSSSYIVYRCILVKHHLFFFFLIIINNFQIMKNNQHWRHQGRKKNP